MKTHPHTDCLDLLAALPIDNILMVTLTVIIAFSARSQAKYTKRLAELSKDADSRDRQRNKPVIRFVECLSSVDRNGTSKTFMGFSITNASPFDITVTSISLGLGIPVYDRGPVTTEMILNHVDRYGDTTLSDCTVPRRLRHGETIRILYDAQEAIAALRHGDGQPIRIRPQCRDSLGNLYTSDHWSIWGQHSFAGFPDPGPGLVPPEQWPPSPKRTRLRFLPTRSRLLNIFKRTS